MKRTLVVLSILLGGLITLTLLGTRSYQVTADNYSGHTQHHQREKKQPKTDGSVTPLQIPETAAYEILLKIMSSSDLDKVESTLRAAYGKDAGFSDAEAIAISNAGYEYRRQIAFLDNLVDQIKHANWPEPSRQVMDRLVQLQVEKEAIISHVVGNLQAQLANYDSLKLTTHINEKVRKKTSGFEVELPRKRVGFLERFTDSLKVSAQAPGCDAQVYVYSDVVDGGYYMAGVGDYSMPYNNCGHTVSLTTEIWGPEGTYATTAYGGAVINLVTSSGTGLEGNFLSTTSADAYCPVIFASYYAGSQSGNRTALPWIMMAAVTDQTDPDNPEIIDKNIGGGAQGTETLVWFRYIISPGANNKNFLATPLFSTVCGTPAAAPDPNTTTTKTVSSTNTRFSLLYKVTGQGAGKFLPGASIAPCFFCGLEVRPPNTATPSASNWVITVHDSTCN